MSESFYASVLHKKRRKGRTMTPAQRLDAQAAFLEAYEHSANILRAAEQAEISREIVYYWLEHDEQFLCVYHLADAAANAHIEAEIRRRAMEGWDEPVYQQGMRVGTVRKYSDTLLIFYAKRRMPEYRDKSQLDVNATHTNATDMRTLQEAIMQALASHPEAKIAVAEALMEKSRERQR